MNFNQFNYVPGLFVIFIVIVFITIRYESRFFAFVRKFWFYKRSTFSYLSTFLFLTGMGGLILSLLDLRGPEEKMKTEIPADKTIILIDTSASMLSEDIKPSRLQKAALIAKHFARKAAGHQMSIVAFAEIQKKIVPFTNDLDLIDARLDSVKNLRNQYGSSALSLAIQESIQYFRETDGEARGNILVLTDGEETSEGIDLKIPKGIRLALIGIGTEMGGRIPLDDGRGFRFGFKKDRGQDVITKLNENFFKQIVADVPAGKYWIANSYTLPSEEVLDFFNSEKQKGNQQQDMVIKPVLMEWIVVPSVIALVLSYLFKSIRILTLGILLFNYQASAQEPSGPELTPGILDKMQQLQDGELNRSQKLKLADDLYKAGAKEESLALFDENLPKKIDKELPPEAYMNYGTALLENGKIQEGLDVYSKLSSSLDDSAEAKNLREMMDKNVVAAFQQQQQQKQKQKEQQSKGDEKDQKTDNQSGQGTQKDNQSGSGNQQQKNKDQLPQQNKKNEENENEKDKGEEKKDDPEENDQDKKDSQPDEKKNLPPKKLPAKLKQLMSDDRQLQLKMIENGTKDLNRRKSRKSKDW